MLIGLMGYGGCGKSTAARYLEKAHGFTAPHIGAPLKRMTYVFLEELGYSPRQINMMIDGEWKRNNIRELGCTPTQLQQWLGTEWGRKCVGEDVWLNIWKQRIRNVLASGGDALSESVRFANESQAIRNMGGVIIEIRRNGVGPLPGGHASEVLPTNPDYVVMNNEDHASLYAALDGIILGIRRSSQSYVDAKEEMVQDEY